MPGFDFEEERSGRLSRKSTLLFSQEDTFLGPALGPVATALQDGEVGISEMRSDLIILCDPYYLFASRKRFGHQFVSDQTAVRIWKQHARAFLGEWKEASRPLVPINYNRWASDRSYRRSLAKRLGLLFTDRGREDVPACAGGSSFDGDRLHGKASAMAVLDRWRHFVEDQTFWQLFDPQVQALSARAFGGEIIPPPLRREYRLRRIGPATPVFPG